MILPLAISISPGSPSSLCASLTVANNSTIFFLFRPPIRHCPNTVLAWPLAFGIGPGHSMGRRMPSPPLRALVIVDWPLSSGVLRRIRGVGGILKPADAKDKLERVLLKPQAPTPHLLYI